MKKLFMALSTSMFALIASPALALDPAYDVVLVECQSTQSYPDKNLELKVIDNTARGVLRIETSETWVGGVRNNSYFVSERNLTPDMRLKWRFYDSRVVSLAIDLTKVDADGNHAATFSRKTKVGKVTEVMTCQLK